MKKHPGKTNYSTYQERLQKSLLSGMERQLYTTIPTIRWPITALSFRSVGYFRMLSHSEHRTPGQTMRVACTLSGKTVPKWWCRPKPLCSQLMLALTQVSPHSWFHEERTVHRRMCLWPLLSGAVSSYQTWLFWKRSSADLSLNFPDYLILEILSYGSSSPPGKVGEIWKGQERPGTEKSYQKSSKFKSCQI